MFAVFFVAAVLVSSAQALSLSCSPPQHLVVFESVRCSVLLPDAGAYANPFNFDEISVQGFLAYQNSGQRTVVDAVYWQDYERSLVGGLERLTPKGNPEWRLRFTPTEAGTLSLFVVATDAHSSNTSSTLSFSVTTGTGKGFVRVGQNKRNFALDDGSSMFPVGMNICWANENGTYAFEDWMGRMAAHGGNYMRIWLSPFACFALETKGTGLLRYSLEAAWRIDWVLDFAAQHDIYVMFTLDSFNSLRIDPPYAMWNDSPYNNVNGGPLNEPKEFFTNAAAAAAYQNRARYVVGRWGFSPHVFSWEFWNEVDLVDSYDSAAISKWHVEMAEWVRKCDPFDHMRTTSMSTLMDKAVQGLSVLEYAQTHHYGLSDMSEGLRNDCLERKLLYPDKPHLHGEYGIPDPTEATEWDPAGLFVHNGLLPTMAAGCSGTAMTWWWDNYVDPLNLWYHFDDAAKVAAMISWASCDWVDVILTYKQPGLRVFGQLGGDSTALLWLQNSNNTWFKQYHGAPLQTIVPTELEFYGLSNAEYRATWYSTLPLTVVRTDSLHVAEKKVVLETPAFDQDLFCVVDKV